MARLQATATVIDEALGAATPETVIQIVAPANQRVVIQKFGLYFSGISVTAEPINWELQTQNTAGTASALTLQKVDTSLPETVQTAAQHDFTAEPTAGVTLVVGKVHPQSGFAVIEPLGGEVVVGGGDRVGLVITAPSAVDVTAMIWIEE